MKEKEQRETPEKNIAFVAATDNKKREKIVIRKQGAKVLSILGCFKERNEDDERQTRKRCTRDLFFSLLRHLF